jgi:quercetin dioxygenase-like cupin family protein
MKAKMTKKRLAFLVIAAAVPTVLSVVALATPGFMILSAPVLATASFVDPVDIKFKVGGQKGGQKADIIHVRDAQQTVIQQIVIGPGGHTGWHSHPGPVVVLVKSGALTFYSAEDGPCTSRTYLAGQAFIDSGQGHVHIARNEGSENLELWATYFDVPPPVVPGGPPPVRIDAGDPGTCGF